MEIGAKIKDFINESIQPLYGVIEKGLDDVVKKTEVDKKELLNAISNEKQSNQNQTDKLCQAFKQLNENVLELIEQVGLLQETIDSMKEKMKALERTCTDPKSTKVVSSQPQIQLLYSKMVDSHSPLGFKINNLKNEETGCVFKITLVNDQEGQYETVADSSVQQELLSAFNPLITDSSIYEMVSPNASKITVLRKGLLRKEQDVLKIIEKQKVKIE